MGCAMFSSRILTSNDTTVWYCSGALDSYSADRARDDLSRLERCNKLVVDLTDCTFIDSGGLRIVQEAAGICGAETVAIRTSDPRIWDLLRIAGLDRVFHVETVEPSESGTRIRRIRTAHAVRRSRYRRAENALITGSTTRTV